jgi:hypothetical protein
MVRSQKEKQSVQHKNILEFNGLLAVFFLILFLISRRNVFVFLALLSLVIGLFLRPVMVPVYALWMKVALILGKMNNWIILSAIFFVVLTPLSIIRRLKWRDPLLVRRNSSSSCWISIDTAYSKEYFERQF